MAGIMRALRARRALAAVASVGLVAPGLLVATMPKPAVAATTSTTFTGTVSATGVAFVNQSYAVSQPETLSFLLTWVGTAQLSLFVKDPSKTLIGQASGPHDPQTLSLQATTVGSYGLGVKAVSGSANYTLTVTPSPPAPTPSVITYRSTIGHLSQPEMYPSGNDVDRANGEIFVADTGDDRVQAYNSSGAQLWQVGTRGPKVNGSFQNPRDVAVVSGEVFVADTGYNRIQVLDEATGTFQMAFPQSFPSIIGISAGVDPSPQHIPVILATDADNNAVTEYTLTGTLLHTYGAKGSGSGQIAAPRDAATDSSGNVYIADYGNSRIVELSGTTVPGGVAAQQIRTWGSFGAATGQFRSPYGVTVDDAGNVYVADANNERIQEFTATGTFIKVFGSPGTGPGQFFQLRRVAVGPGPNPYVIGADLWGAVLQKFDGSTAAPTLTIGTGPPPDGGFNEPFGVTTTPTDVVVADTDNQRMEAFTSSTESLDFAFGLRGFGATNFGFNWPREIAYASATNTFWVADTKNFRLTEFANDNAGTPTGRIIGGKNGTALGQFNWIYGVAILGSDVVVADTLNNRVQLVNPAVSGAGGIVWSTPGFNQPKAVTVSGGNVYVADGLNHQVVELSGTDGTVMRTLPTPTLGALTGIAVSSAGRIWLSDSTNSRIAELSSSGQLLQTFGTFGTLTNQFNSPAGLALATVGGTTVLYVVDQENSRVETFSLT
jgi:tripartite motif-containing protein 71